MAGAKKGGGKGGKGGTKRAAKVARKSRVVAKRNIGMMKSGKLFSSSVKPKTFKLFSGWQDKLGLKTRGALLDYIGDKLSSYDINNIGNLGSQNATSAEV